MDPLLFAETRAHISSTSREVPLLLDACMQQLTGACQAGAPMKSTLIRVETSDKAVILDSKASDGREVLDTGEQQLQIVCRRFSCTPSVTAGIRSFHVPHVQF